jgi:hypothetical protein
MPDYWSNINSRLNPSVEQTDQKCIYDNCKNLDSSEHFEKLYSSITAFSDFKETITFDTTSFFMTNGNDRYLRKII